MGLGISAPSPAAALMLVWACDGFHAGHISAGGAPAAAVSARGQALAVLATQGVN